MGRRDREDLEAYVEFLRSWGLKVKVVHKPARPGAWGAVRALLLHHTGDTCDVDRVDDCLRVVRDGRAGADPVPGPLAQEFVGQDGVVYVVAAPRPGQLAPGRANHAGKGRYPRLGIPLNDGNHWTSGTEVQCSGAHPLSRHPEVYRVAVRLQAAKCAWYGLDADAVIGHKEYTDRKIDPRDDMDDVRRDVARELAAGPTGATAPTTPEEDDVQLTETVPMGPGARKSLGDRDTVGELLVLSAQGGLAALQTQRSLAEVTGEVAAIRAAVAALSAGSSTPITEAQIIAAGKAAGEALADRLASALTQG